MAYSSQPQQSTYKTERYTFIGNPQAVDGISLANQRIVNMIPELNYVSVTQDKSYFLKKRPGLLVQNSFTPGVGRGLFNWMSHIFTVIGSTCYVDSNVLFTLSTTTGRVGFSAYFGQTYGQALIIVDGTNGWVIKPDLSVIPITSTGFPNPHVPDPVTIDEYLILSKAGTGDFYQSALDDPTSWTPGDFITAEMFPDATVALTKFKNYIVVGGTNSIEFFYDSGNPSGSSFSRSEAVIQQVGIAVPNTLKTTEEDIVFVGDSAQGGKTVWMIEKFKTVDIGIETVRLAIDAEGLNLINASGVIVRTIGHQLYILSLTTRTFVYDMDLKIWHEWDFNGGVFDFRYASYNNANSPLLLHSSNGIVYSLDQFNYLDNGSPINCLIQTDEINFKSYNRKSWYRLTIGSAQYNDLTPSYMQVSWTDNNFMTTTSPRNLMLNADLPAIFKMGMSRNRAYKFQFTENKPLRLEYYEIDVNVLTA